MRHNNNKIRTQSLVNLKDEKWLWRQKRAGRCVAQIHRTFIDMVREEKRPNLSLKDIEKMALSVMDIHDCTPTFQGYKGFPGAVCLSVNSNMVHGIPTDYVLQDGDVVRLDLGATFEGAIADAAYTCIYGEPKSKEHVRLLKTCKGALQAGIDAIEIGKHLGVIGNAIHKYCKDSGFGLITNYGGHGIDYDTPHAEPFVANKERPDAGIRIQAGLSIAIEPMLVIGDTRTKVESDNWTVSTPGINCHFEHSVTIMEDGKKHMITEILRDAN